MKSEGEREMAKKKFFFLVFLVLLMLFILNQTTIIGSASNSGGSWASRRHDPRNTGFDEGLAPNTNQSLWTTNIGPKSEGEGGGYVPSAAVGCGKIFVGSRDGVLYSMNELSGETVWVRPLESDWDLFGPALAYDKVYVVSDSGKLFALDEKTGEILWEKNIPASPSINVADDRLFIAAFNGSFYCVNATSGARIWTRELFISDVGTYIITHPAVADGRVFVGAVCLSETDGSTLWNITLNGQEQGIGSRNFPAVVDGKVFIGVGDTLYCLEEFTGTVLWNYTTGGEVFRSPPAIAYGQVYVPSTDGVFYCLDAQNGTLVWKKTGVGGIVRIPYGSTSAGPAVADGKIYLPHPDWFIICLNATNGEVIWRFLTDGPPAPPLVADGLVFATLVHDPQIYAFGQPASQGQVIWLYLGVAVIVAVTVIGTLVWRTRSKSKKQ